MGANPARRPFRFEAAWLQHEGFKDLLSASWNRDIRTQEALSMLRRTLQMWNKEVFGDVHKRKDELLCKIKTVQDQLDLLQTDDLLIQESVLLKELDVVLEQEEVLWF